MTVFTTHSTTGAHVELKPLDAVDSLDEEEKKTPYMEMSTTLSPDHPKITPTLPVPLEDMSNYVASCHANNNNYFSSQFQVSLPTVSCFVK